MSQFFSDIWPRLSVNVIDNLIIEAVNCCLINNIVFLSEKINVLKDCYLYKTGKVCIMIFTIKNAIFLHLPN